MTPYVYTTMQTCTPHGTARTNHMHHVTGQFSGVPTRLVFRFAVNGLDLTRKFRRRLFSSTHMQIFSISLLKLLVCCTFNSLFGLVHFSFGWSRLLLKNVVVFCLHFQELAILSHVTCVSRGIVRSWKGIAVIISFSQENAVKTYCKN